MVHPRAAFLNRRPLAPHLPACLFIPQLIALRRCSESWARTGDQVNPERRSSGSQFYITLKPTPFLDGGYTVFGRTISGMDVVENIRRGDTIESIEVKAE
ncbi:MAG: peptidylprolyl isomerase [Proteobacteria bacterium]|nr:peptidylprolyl isomerase [Pseudomonadota bacterium]